MQPEEDQANTAGDIEENPLCADSGRRSHHDNAQWDRDQLLNLQAHNLKEIYYAVERSFLTKQRKSLTSDWIAKNQNEKPQSFSNFKRKCKNWDIKEVIILEMWDEDSQQPNTPFSRPIPKEQIQQAALQECNFQRMLINNMESVFKIFFRGMKVVRVKSKRDRAAEQPKDRPRGGYEHIE